MRYVLKVLFAGFVSLVVLWVFTYSLIRGCTAGLDQVAKETRQKRGPSTPPSTYNYRRPTRAPKETAEQNERQKTWFDDYLQDANDRLNEQIRRAYEKAGLEPP